MNTKCFEIGTIQAFLDGETTPDVSLRLSDHIGACDVCARLLADAEDENSIVFSTLERELNSLVPTQRLWSRINETIEVEKSRTPIWQKFLVYVSASLANPSIAAAAGIVVVMGLFAVMIGVNDDGRGIINNRVTDAGPTVERENQTVDIATTGSDGAIASSAAPPKFEISKHSDSELRALATRVNARATQRQITPQTADYRIPAADAYLPGEESYVRTISDLRQNVDVQKDTVLTPSTRVSYERDMAVVDDSIKRMREVVKKNPRNQAARQVLYASYQDKIDLLNSVSQREELMASLR